MRNKKTHVAAEKALVALIEALTSDEVLRSAAKRHLDLAIREFMATRIDPTKMSGRSVAALRLELTALSDALHRLKESSRLSGEAQAMLIRAGVHPNMIWRFIDNVGTAPESALRSARALKNRQGDGHKTVLAIETARTLRDVLGIQPKKTRDFSTSNPRGGAAYARLLRATFRAAGINPPEDIGVYVDAGIAHLD